MPKLYVYIDTDAMRQNRNRPASARRAHIVVSDGVGHRNAYKELRLTGPCEFVFDPAHPIDGAAHVWIETNDPVTTDKDFQ